MLDFLQLVVSGLATGAIYALAAMGFTLLWQASGTINFAQGEFVMLPAFMILGVMGLAGLPLIPAFLIAVAASLLVLGGAFKKLVVDPLLRHGVLPLVVATLGLAIALKNGIKASVSAEALPFPAVFSEGVWSIGGLRISIADIGTLLVAGAIVLAVHLFLEKTRTGRAMQATAQNADAARVLGVPVERMVLYTFALNALLAATAALLIAPTYLAKFDMGEAIGMKAFYAAIIGGFNQVRGALIGGLLVGVLENLAAGYFAPGYKDAVALLVFLVVILFRPEGLVGKIEERRV